MKGLDLKELFQQAAITVSAPGGGHGQQKHSLHLHSSCRWWMRLANPMHLCLLWSPAWRTPSLGLSPAPHTQKLKVHLFTDAGLAPNALWSKRPRVELLW